MPQLRAGSGADWFARAWGSDDGLPDNNVSGVVQTPDGYLWVSTYGGLMRFDGANFQEFRPDALDGIPGRGVQAMLLDRRDRIWLALDRGIVVCVDSDVARVFTEREGMPTSQPQSIKEDGEGGIWIYHSRGELARIDDGGATVLGVAEGLPGPGPCSMAMDFRGRFWIVKNGQLGLFHGGRFDKRAVLPDPAAAIGAAAAGGVWICSGSQLFYFDGEGVVEERGRVPSAVAPRVVFEDRSGAVWIGTTASGLFRFDEGGMRSVPAAHSEILSITQDREGNLWVGTGGGGLNRLRPRTVKLIGVEAGLPFESVRSVAEDAAGSLWLATQNGMLIRRQGAEWENVSAWEDWPGGRASCVAGDPSGAVWIGTTDAGLLRWKEGRFDVWRRRDGLAHSSVRSLLIASGGDVWIAVDNGLQRLRGGEFQSFNLPRPIRSLRAMAEDAAGNIWVGSSEGRLFRVSADGEIAEPVAVAGGPLSIRALRATADGSLWIGYAGFGLGRVHDGNYFRITTADGLFDDYISQIVTDDSDRLWLAGNHGIFQVSLREASDFAEGRARRIRSIVYGRGEGLPNLQATYDNDPGVLRARDGRVWVAARTGLAVIHPGNITENPKPPPVLIERVAADGETLALYGSRSPLRNEGKGVADLGRENGFHRLRPEHRRIEFEFTALSFTAPENVQFRYRLEGLDQGWSQPGTERRARYSRLPAGNYRFHVIACNNDGVWNEGGAVLGFIVLPFVWQTWWFRLGILGAFTLTVIAAVRYVSFRRLRWRLRVLEQQAALDKERTRIARDLHDDLGGSLTEAALLLDMTQHRAAPPAEVNERVRHCAALVRQVSKSVDAIIWAINPRNDTLPYLIDYISQYAVEFLHAACIRCRVDLPDSLPALHVSPDARHNLFLVVKEALNNVARHAGATEARLRVIAAPGMIRLEIQDNGRGFESAVDNARADGLRNMRQRMEEIGGRFCVESREGEGTRVWVEYWLGEEKTGG